ncbi:MAG: nitronate monooxygenase [Gammaproteobacteria bacterium]|nr:MAG: nitronate monooxygenase [Gammaproteobacteria bacterium]
MPVPPQRPAARASDHILETKAADDYRLQLNGQEFVPIMIGGMGVDISTRELALVASRLGGIGHISDAMVPTVIDRHFKTRYVKDKLKRYRFNIDNEDKAVVQFNLDTLAEAQRRHVEETMQAKQGDGAIFINSMEKLTMNNPRETLKVRLNAALDAGIDGITLSAGLHLGSFDLMKDNPRFNDATLGIIVSSARALNLFLRRAKRIPRMPDFIVVEGPLAGGHLGFGIDEWQNVEMRDIVVDVMALLAKESLKIPVIPAGGIFTGSDAVEYLEMGCDGIQVATRFTVTHECGLPDKAKQAYFAAAADDIVVNSVSPTGYPMRMLRQSPAIGAGTRPNCESFGYLLDSTGHCSYIDAYYAELQRHGKKGLSVEGKICLCTHMSKYHVWTCGETTYRLKDTTVQGEDGNYQILDAEHVFHDYQFSTEHRVKLPPGS